MDSSTDPNELYEKWLEIPAEYCPPNHYVLLGIDDFCDDNDTIDAAAKQRTAYLHQIAAGPNRKDIQRLMGEVAVARRALLNAESRQQYDQWLLTPDEESGDVVTSQPPSFAIQLDPQSKSAVGARAAQSPSADRKAGEKPASRRKQKSAWDAYKLHLLSASVLACAVGIFAFVNRGGGRRASAIPQKQSENAPSGQGFKKQTGFASPAKSSIQAKSGSANSKRKNIAAPRKRSGPTLSGPAGFDGMTATDGDPKKAIAALPRFDAPNTSSLNAVSKGTRVSLPANWRDGLSKIDVFNDEFHDQFKISPAHRDAFRIQNGKLIVLRSKTAPLYPRFTSLSHQLAPGAAVAIDTSMQPNINDKANIGLFVGKLQLLVHSTSKGISVRTKKLSERKRGDALYNLRPKGSPTVATLVVARDKKNHKILHWLLTSGQSSCAGTVATDLNEEDAQIGISLTCPKTAMDHQLSISNFRLGEFTKEPAWPN